MKLIVHKGIGGITNVWNVIGNYLETTCFPRSLQIVLFLNSTDEVRIVLTFFFNKFPSPFIRLSKHSLLSRTLKTITDVIRPYEF